MCLAQVRQVGQRLDGLAQAHLVRLRRAAALDLLVLCHALQRLLVGWQTGGPP
jgi:hypothetical protein